MLLEAYLLDISRGTHVDRRDILFHLSVVALFVALVVHEHSHNLHDAPYENSHTDEADNQLAYALAFKLFGSKFVRRLVGIVAVIVINVRVLMEVFSPRSLDKSI